MKNPASKFWDWFMNRSPRDAAVPDVQPGSSAWPHPSSGDSAIQPIERHVEMRSFAGLLNTPYRVETLGRSVDDELVRCHHDGADMILGCGHKVSGFQDKDKKPQDDRTIAGLCAYCVREYQPQVQKGEMDPLHAERLSLVCSECAKVSTSGYLCCPRHCKPTAGSDGTTHYVDSETALKMARQDVVGKAFRAVMWLFGQPEESRDLQRRQE